MSFRESLNNIQLEYRTLEDDVVDNFYIPALKEAAVYKRAVGFFSSTILLQISEGLGSIATRGGKIRLLVSPKLDERDYIAIKDGYELRQVIENKFLESFDEDIDFEQKEARFTLLSYLISRDIMDIKVAVVDDSKNDNAMYHEKLGIMTDNEGDILSFSGSANETGQAFNLNYECIDVYCSWKSEEAYQRCQIKDFRFDNMWTNAEKSLTVIPFPDVIKEKILKYNHYDKYDFAQLDIDLEKIHTKRKLNDRGPSDISIKFHDYQNEAIDNWEKAGYKGIFDMATGTGKTFTGLGALCRLYKNKKRVVAVICAPYIHLVEQWAEEADKFGISPIKCYGEFKSYGTKLKNQLQKFKAKRTDFVCIITTNVTFTSARLQESIIKNLSQTLLIVDEAHNFGAMKLSSYLTLNYPYRLALSATLDRYGDSAGTQKLYDFFGEKCIEYSLERAIKEQKLTRYHYHPIVVSLTEDEYERYHNLTEKIRKFHVSADDDIPDALKTLLVKRARIVAGAENKVLALKNKIAKYSKDNNLLVYCGAVKYFGFGGEDDVGRKQIEIVKDMLNNDLGIVSTKFTSEEDSLTRQGIIKAYVNEEIQALVAIKCLDEGVNVPAIKTAFILASSANPKEYIQRRGRVLRKHPGKEFAEIYDFITLPRPLEEVFSISEAEKNTDRVLIKKELIRMIDFANLSNNPSECDELIDEMKSAYNLETINMEDINKYE